MKKILPVVATVIALSSCSSPANAPTVPTPPAVTTPATIAPPVEGTLSQRNAVKKAESYLSHQAFSRSGLIKQLEFEKFSTEDATYAVDHVKVDWVAQADKKAKQYLEHQAFSHDSLVKQLEFEGFTPEEAEHGVASTGL